MEGETALQNRYVSREMVLDNVVERALLECDPLWEKDPVVGDWHKRTPEFVAQRCESEKTLSAEIEIAESALALTLLDLGKNLPTQENAWNLQAWACNKHKSPPYETITSFSEVGVWLHLDSKSAINVWRSRLLSYAATHSGDVLWWRIRPEISGKIPFGNAEAVWAVYSRLFIGPRTTEHDV